MSDLPPSSEPVTTRASQPWHGIDVSAYQGHVAWERVRAAGVSFAWIKATEGAGHVDARFAENWAGSLCAGVLRGAYHYLRGGVSAEEQARHFVATYPGGGELPVALDIEEAASGETPTVLVVRMLTWLRAVEEATGAKPIVYTMPSFAASRLRCPEAIELASYGLWIAHWQVAVPSVPAPWTEWSCWQSSSTGTVDGIRGPVDIDVLRPDALGLAATEASV